MDFYFTISTKGVAEYKDRGSKFLAYAFPVKNKEECRQHLQALRKEHSKAVHHCFAYRLGCDGNNYRVSDDGEPSGTAGKQIMARLDSLNLTDTLVIVVRYFGGVLLGIPGLINAYKTSTALALQCTPVVKKPVEITYVLQFNYTEMNDVMHILKKHDCTLYKNDLQIFCKIETGIAKSRLAEVLHALQNIRNIDITLSNKTG